MWFRSEVDNQDGHQHKQRAEQGVEEELDGGVFLPRTTPDTDQEINRHQHYFPEDIKEEEIQGAKDTYHADFQKQEEGEILFDSINNIK